LKNQLLPLVLARFPGFAPVWEKHRRVWKFKDAGLCNDMAQFAKYVSELIRTGAIAELRPVASTLEEILADCDSDVRYAVTVGFLEDLTTLVGRL